MTVSLIEKKLNDALNSHKIVWNTKTNWCH